MKNWKRCALGLTLSDAIEKGFGRKFFFCRRKMTLQWRQLRSKSKRRVDFPSSAAADSSRRRLPLYTTTHLLLLPCLCPLEHLKSSPLHRIALIVFPAGHLSTDCPINWKRRLDEGRRELMAERNERTNQPIPSLIPVLCPPAHPPPFPSLSPSFCLSLHHVTLSSPLLLAPRSRGRNRRYRQSTEEQLIRTTKANQRHLHSPPKSRRWRRWRRREKRLRCVTSSRSSFVLQSSFVSPKWLYGISFACLRGCWVSLTLTRR